MAITILVALYTGALTLVGIGIVYAALVAWAMFMNMVVMPVWNRLVVDPLRNAGHLTERKVWQTLTN